MVYLGGAIGINTWLMKGYFDTIPPRSLEESAMLDGGATPFAAFWRIILPLVRPILVVVFILAFIGTYSEFMLAQVMLQSTDKLTLAVGMNLFLGDQYAKRWGGVFFRGGDYCLRTHCVDLFDAAEAVDFRFDSRWSERLILLGGRGG